MKALILNSGMGSRMGVLTSEHPKCMTEISNHETILSRQLRQLSEAGVTDVVITTGLFDGVLVDYCRGLKLPLHFTFVNNPDYRVTNYIYSIYCARKALDDDILLMHGDLVFENTVLDDVLAQKGSCMTVSSAVALPEKDFKAVIHGGRIEKVGIEFFDDALAAQPLYKLAREDWRVWLEEIVAFCERGERKCYAENAFNQVSDRMHLMPLDVGDRLCSEVDNPEDLSLVSVRLQQVENRSVYMCFATDILHGGHIAIIRKAQRLGKLTIGVLSDEAISGYKRYPLVPASERRVMMENIAGVCQVVEQKTLSYRENLLKYQPDIVVHGDDWVTGFQKPIRDEVVQILHSYGGRLVEFPYSSDPKYKEMDSRIRADLAMPDIRRGRPL